MSDSLWPHGLQHARPPCPSPIPGVHPNSCSLSRWCHPTISSSVVPFSSRFDLSQHQGLFRWVNSLHHVARVLEFQLQHLSSQWVSNEHIGLISFRMDWLDLLAVQGALKSLLQHHSSKASILWFSAFFIVQLSHTWLLFSYKKLGFPCGSDGKESACNAGDIGSISRSGKSTGGGSGNPLQYPCLGNPMNRGALQAIIHAVKKSWMQLKWLTQKNLSLRLIVKITENILYSYCNYLGVIPYPIQ